MERIILHIDVNSAFLSWSAVKLLQNGNKKDIREEISVIAGDPSKRHGVIIAASIPAKKIGIRPPTNLYEARKKCKDLIVVEPDREFYKMCSNNLMNYLRELFPLIEQFSIDECFIDYSLVKNKYGDEVKFAYKVKDEIYKKFGFTVNIGIGNNKLCAKMASDFEKPNKVHTLYKSEFKDKMWKKDISELFMAGKSSCQKLRKLGINTIGELAIADDYLLYSNLKSFGKVLKEYANGIDNSQVNSESYNDRKSIGYSRTLSNDTDNLDIIYTFLEDFSKKISKELINRGLYADTLVVTVRNQNFKTYNHQEKLKNSIQNEKEIFLKGKEIFHAMWDEEPVRLIGLSATNLTDSLNYQISLFDNNNQIKSKEIDKLINRINKELGSNLVFKGDKLKK